MTQTQTQPKTTEETKAPALDEFVYFLTPTEDTDERECAEWKQKLLDKTPDCKAKFVSSLNLSRLSERHLVIALYRPARKGSEITAGPAIKVVDHWLADGDDGKVNSRTFLRALNMTCLPAVVKLRRDKIDDQGTLRLGYA